MEWQLTRGVLEENYTGNLIYLLKYMIELSYHSEDEVTAKYL